MNVCVNISRDQDHANNAQVQQLGLSIDLLNLYYGLKDDFQNFPAVR